MTTHRTRFALSHALFAVTAVVMSLLACSGKVESQVVETPLNCTRCDPAAPECTDLRTNPNHCGACGTVCAAGSTCAAGQCTVSCAAGLTACGAACVDVQIDPKNCGGCGTACAGQNAGRACVKGKCAYGACAKGFADCDGDRTNGCEKDVRTDLASCGGCGTVCAPANVNAASCTGGECGYDACRAGTLDCDGNRGNGCETDPKVDLANCGACGKKCDAGQICTGGICGVPPPLVAQTSFAYPTDGNGGVIAPRPFVIAIQSIDPALIYFTADGSTPSVNGATTTRAVSPVSFPVSTNVIVKWFTSADPTIQTHNATIDTSRQSNIGEFLDDVRFDKTGGPVVVASPGEVLNGGGHFQGWNCPMCAGGACCPGTSGYCPGCVRVYGFGIRSVEGCNGIAVPPKWPGVDQPGFRFTVKAPVEPGVYRLRRGVGLDFFCRPGSGVGGDDGTIVVR